MNGMLKRLISFFATLAASINVFASKEVHAISNDGSENFFGVGEHELGQKYSNMPLNDLTEKDLRIILFPKLLGSVSVENAIVRIQAYFPGASYDEIEEKLIDHVEVLVDIGVYDFVGSEIVAGNYSGTGVVQ